MLKLFSRGILHGEGNSRPLHRVLYDIQHCLLSHTACMSGLQLLEIVSIESARGISRSPAENLNLSNLALLPRHRSVQGKCGPEPDLESMLEKYLHRNPKIFAPLF